MPNGYFTTPLTFIIDVLFSIYIAIVALRLIMQWAQWEYHNPIVQMIIKATQVPVKWLRRYIPPVGKWDTATVVLLFALTIIKLALLGALYPANVQQPVFIAWVIADIFSLFITLFSASIIIQIVLSWITPAGSYNPVTPLVHSMNKPLLSPFKKLLPPLAGIDLSPLFAILALQVLAMLVLPLLTGSY